jgi:hypothetical protein
MHNAAQADLDKLETCFFECDEDLASCSKKSSCERRESHASGSKNQCVVTPRARSHGCGLIALYTSPYLTPAG